MTAGPGEPLDAARASLVRECSEVFAPESVGTCLGDSYQQLFPARVHGTCRCLLTASPVSASMQRHGSPWPQLRVPLVSFVCTANSGRSQMAAALLAHEAGEQVSR